MSKVVDTLEELWRQGRLKDLEEDLDRFIRDHLGEIREWLRKGTGEGLEIVRRRYERGEISDRHFVDYCVRSFLRRKGSCNPRRDIEAQRREIDNEIWYEGERLRAPVPPDLRDQIAKLWCRRHARGWRDWRIFELLYVWDKMADRYVPLVASERDP